jgi:hypothetical protein
MRNALCLTALAAASFGLAAPAHADPVCVFVTSPPLAPLGGCVLTPFARACQTVSAGGPGERVDVLVCYPAP